MNQALLDMLLGLGIKIGAFVLVVLAVLAWKQLKAFIELKMGQAKYDEFVSKIESIVRALEQIGIIQHWDGAEKKRQATILAHQLRDFLKLNISDDMIDTIIEAFVQVLNTEAGKFEVAPPVFQTYTGSVSPFVGPIN